MSEQRRSSIVGAGLAGAKAAEALREEGFDGRIVLFGAEAHRPYERPPLSKDYLHGHGRAGRRCSCTRPAGTPSTTSSCGSADPVTAIDPAAHEVGTARRRPARLRQAAARHGRQPAPAAGAGRRPGRRAYLRTPRRQRRGSRAPCARARRVVDHRRRLDRAGDAPRPRAPPAPPSPCSSRPSCRCCACSARELATVFADLHRDARRATCAPGSRWRPESRGRRAAAVGSVRLADGREIAADLVIVGVGIAPNVELAEAAGLDVDNGIAGRRAPAHLRPRHLRRRRRGERLPPAAGPAPARRALGQRPAPAGGRGPDHARPAGRLRPAAVLLHRPVRPGHGVHRLRRRRTTDAGRARRPARPASSSRSGCATGGVPRR